MNLPAWTTMFQRALLTVISSWQRQEAVAVTLAVVICQQGLWVSVSWRQTLSSMKYPVHRNITCTSCTSTLYQWEGRFNGYNIVVTGVYFVHLLCKITFSDGCQVIFSSSVSSFCYLTRCTALVHCVKGCANSVIGFAETAVFSLQLCNIIH